MAATGLVRRFGGKGANQAVAAARQQGASVSMIGCVGADDLGKAYYRRLRSEGVMSESGRPAKRVCDAGAAWAYAQIETRPRLSQEFQTAHDAVAKKLAPDADSGEITTYKQLILSVSGP